jgi:hypothetical protein
MLKPAARTALDCRKAETIRVPIGIEVMTLSSALQRPDCTHGLPRSNTRKLTQSVKLGRSVKTPRKLDVRETEHD